jgi:hypothetical protein
MLEDLIQSLRAQGLTGQRIAVGQPAPVVPLDLFFEENTDESSIACNLPDHPGLPFFYETLKAIKSRPDVQDVLVEIYEMQEAGDWPFAERVYILTRGTRSDVFDWTRELQPDEVDDGWFFAKPEAAPEVKTGYNVVSIWWD